MTDVKSMSGSASNSIELPVSAGEVWTVIGDFDGLPRWNPGLERSELSNGGTRRTLTLKAGGKVVEDLVDRDEAARSISYSIVEGPIPVTRHRATLSASDRGPNQCTVLWRSEFEPNNVPADVVTGIFTGIFEGGLKHLAALFGDRARRQ
jgi:hypothetical protein